MATWIVLFHPQTLHHSSGVTHDSHHFSLSDGTYLGLGHGCVSRAVSLVPSETSLIRGWMAKFSFQELQRTTKVDKNDKRQFWKSQLSPSQGQFQTSPSAVSAVHHWSITPQNKGTLWNSMELKSKLKNKWLSGLQDSPSLKAVAQIRLHEIPHTENVSRCLTCLQDFTRICLTGTWHDPLSHSIH